MYKKFISDIKHCKECKQVTSDQQTLMADNQLLRYNGKTGIWTVHQFVK